MISSFNTMSILTSLVCRGEKHTLLNGIPAVAGNKYLDQ